MTVHTYTLYNASTGGVIGRAIIDVTHEMELSATSGQFDEHVTMTLVSQTTPLITAVLVTLTASCSGGCTATDSNAFDGPATLTLGATVDGWFTYENEPDPGPDYFNTNYTIFSIAPGATPIDPEDDYPGPFGMRCDSTVGASTGCVFADYRPDLELSQVTHGASATMVLWAQLFLPDEWGTPDAPLTRLADTQQQDRNRDIICDSTFVADPNPSTDPNYPLRDSCDEYAFAASRQSGAMLGQRGADCAEVRPFLQNGTWYVTSWSDGTERCVRGHVPLGENRAAGNALSTLTTQMRILDGEEYTVTVYAD
ncbi:hypothetical protein ACQEVC_34715 [Plantactinospora sp. CA-294935]|uniref:hypothetical protein n=1 Tax=Plantactinospora sp. CA-294935 TaxID=3240012 RepID=UPI003D8C26BE